MQKRSSGIEQLGAFKKIIRGLVSVSDDHYTDLDPVGA